MPMNNFNSNNNRNSVENSNRLREHDEQVRLRNASMMMMTTTTTTTGRPPMTRVHLTTTTTTSKMPLLYKLNINDSYSKALLDNIKSKDNNRLNILIKKPPMSGVGEDGSSGGQPKLGQLVVDTNLQNPISSSINSNSIMNINNNINLKHKLPVPVATTPFPFNQLNPIILNKDKFMHPQITTR